MNIAVVGGGINGLFSAWELAKQGHKVTLYERNSALLAETSSASSKLLHGGLRYLENGEFRLVKEALRERKWWIDTVPQYTQELPLLLPIYKNASRPRWQIGLGLWLYDFLAGKYNLKKRSWIGRDELLQLKTGLESEGLCGAYMFYDGQMDEGELGAWVVEQARQSGVQIKTGSKVCKISVDGSIEINGELSQYDRVINTAGPWAENLLVSSNIKSSVKIDHIRGSHIFFDFTIPKGFFLQVPYEKRIFFVLPYQGRTLVGTTEIRQGLTEKVTCTDEEVEYLLNAYNHYFSDKKTHLDVVGKFAGLRPLIKSSDNPRQATREYLVQKTGAIVNVYGGKWTTARALSKAVAKVVVN